MRLNRLTKRRKRLILLAGAVLLGALGISTSGLFRPSRRAPRRDKNDPVLFVPGVRARVLYVIDGDTFDAAVSLSDGKEVRERIRMLCINTPEMEGTGYRRATAALVGLVGRREVVLEAEEPDRFERGNYGRVLAYAIVDGTNANVEMVRLGWSKYWTKFGPGRIPEAFRKAEAEARGKGAGLWKKKGG